MNPIIVATTSRSQHPGSNKLTPALTVERRKLFLETMKIAIIAFIALDMLGKFLIMANQAMEHEDGEKEEQTIYHIEPDNIAEILEKIFIGYNKNIRPYYKVKPITIEVSVGVSSINYISEENMEFQTVVYVRQHWHDPRLAYGNDNTSIILQGDLLDRVWLPDTFIENARKSVIDKDNRAAFVNANGSIFYSFRTNNIILSSMNFLKYPMDEQTLRIQFYSYAHDVNKIVYEWKDGKLFIHDELAAVVIEDIELLKETHKYMTGFYSCIAFQFKVRRRLGYFMLQFYFPCVLSVLVSWLPFWMDRYEIGDRVSLGITTLLTEVFLSQYINSAMPQVSYIKAADEFLLASFIFILMALIESVVVYNVRMDVREKKKKKQVPPPKDKPQENEGFAEDIPLSITEVFQTQLKQTKNANVCSSPGQQTSQICTKSRDMSFLVDKMSRVIFPFSYIMFVAYYFGRYVLFNRIEHTH